MTGRLLIVLGTGALAACGGTTTAAPAGSGAASTSGSGSQPGGIATGATSLGTVLTDSATGRTLYYFTPEKGGQPVCAGDAACNATWPPETVTSTPSALAGVTGQFATVSLPDGSKELTYNTWPLHTYAGDSRAGDTHGQGIQGKWFVATPSLTAARGGSGSASGSPAGASTSGSPYGY